MKSLAQAQRELQAWQASGKDSWLEWSDYDPFLAERVGSLYPGEVLLLAARTNAGKSMYALRAMAAAACPCLYLSLEDSVREVAKRSQAVPSSRLSDIFVAGPKRRLSAVKAAIEEAAPQALGGPWMVTLDYAQRVAYDGNLAAWSATDAISRSVDELQVLGQQLGFVLLLISQVTRPPKPSGKDQEGDGPALTLYDLKGSSALEDFANVILLMNRQGKDRVLVNVAKHKSAPVGATQLYTRTDTGWLEPTSRAVVKESDIFG